jgi:ureidoacrylate peracid hydrolase
MKNLYAIMIFIVAMLLASTNMVYGEVEILQTLEEQVNPKITALLINGMQNDFVSDEGKLGKIGVNLKPIQDAIPTINKFVEEARKAGVKVIWIRLAHSLKDALPNYMARNIARKKGKPFTEKDFLAQEGSWGAGYYTKVIKRLPSEIEVIKHTFSAFENNKLETYLKASGIKTIICIGCVTNVCIQAIASAGWHKGYYTIIASDAVASNIPSLHEATLKNHRIYYGYTPKSSKIINIWQK